MSTIGELRKFLSTVDESKDDLPIILGVEYGRGCYMVVTDVDFNLSQDDDDPDDECLRFSGEEDDEMGEW
jgi:hypothetical protein